MHPDATGRCAASMAAGETVRLRRNRVFAYDAYLNILNEGGEAL